MNENDLLQSIYVKSRGLPERVTLGPGDDMGAVELSGQDLLVTVDQAADGVHFDLQQHSLDRVGHKAMARSLSDVAAMAAKPVGAVVAVSLPRTFQSEQAEKLFDAMRASGERFDCPLIGGDIAIWDGALLLTTTVFAEPAGIEPVRRDTARPGDRIYVTGQLGYSLLGHHLDFTPRIDLARTLARHADTRPTAMMDLSDGLAQDLPRMTPHATFDADRLPIRSIDTPDDQQPAWRHAIGDGEDYELLFTAKPDQVMPNEIEGVSITPIGRVTDAGGCVLQLDDGQTVNLQGLGWEHRA